MPRERAEKLLSDVITRTRRINDNPHGLVWIETVELSGSLTQPCVTHVGDIDLRIVFTWRYSGDELIDRLDQPGRGVLDGAANTHNYCVA